MVSEKVIIVLLILAILLSVVSIAITLNVGTIEMPQKQIDYTGSGAANLQLFVESSGGENRES